MYGDLSGPVLTPIGGWIHRTSPLHTAMPIPIVASNTSRFRGLRSWAWFKAEFQRLPEFPGMAFDPSAVSKATTEFGLSSSERTQFRARPGFICQLEELRTPPSKKVIAIVLAKFDGGAKRASVSAAHQQHWTLEENRPSTVRFCGR